jgi:hypothetical protein
MTDVQTDIENSDGTDGTHGTALCSAASSGSVRFSGNGTDGTKPGGQGYPAVLWDFRPREPESERHHR